MITYDQFNCIYTSFSASADYTARAEYINPSSIVHSWLSFLRKAIYIFIER